MSEIDTRLAAYDRGEEPDDQPTNPSPVPAMAEVIEARLSRRGLLGAALASTAAIALPGLSMRASKAEAAMGGTAPGAAATRGAPSTLNFSELANVITKTHRVSPGYDAEVLIRWGDPIHAGLNGFDPTKQTADEQSRRFGFNNDFVAFMPLPAGSAASDRGLLCVNHEYTRAPFLFPGSPSGMKTSRTQTDVSLAAHGHSVLEIRRDADGHWDVVRNSPYNRRITALDTPIAVSGPAAGHPRLQTSEDPSGTRVIGTLNNCAGGVTPWGTVLTAEENFNQYFTGALDGLDEQNALARYGFDTPAHNWSDYHDRFDVRKEPHEPNRFGWIVEIDPYDPQSTPVKRTALGRFRHEGASPIVNRDGRLVLYSGDDQMFEYIYRFVSDETVDLDDRRRNRDLLDRGTLSVAKFHADGSVAWLPLVHGHGPLTAEHGFDSQADVMIEARRAADLLGATPMDRPEDVEPNPATGRVYAMLTNNARRTADLTDAANPRSRNLAGHIIEILPPGEDGDRDHAADSFAWDIFLMAGRRSPEGETTYHPQTTEDGEFACPDNCAFDNRGRMWIATDQGSSQAERGIPDGMRATDTTGQARGLTRLFFACPEGAEMCGPAFTPDNTTLFLAVQHPGEGPGSSYDHPSTRWPDFDPAMPPRPAIVAVTRQGGGEIGG